MLLVKLLFLAPDLSIMRDIVLGVTSIELAAAACSRETPITWNVSLPPK